MAAEALQFMAAEVRTPWGLRSVRAVGVFGHALEPFETLQFTVALQFKVAEGRMLAKP